MTFIKLDQADLDSPCRELSNSDLGIVVALVVRWQIIFCRLVLGVQSSCRTSSTIGKIAPTARPKKETNIASTRSSLITCKYCLSTLFLQLEQGNTSTFQLPFLRQHIQTLDHYIPYQFERIPLWRPCKKKNSKTYRNCPRANLLSWCQDLQYGSPPYPAQGYP